MSIWEDFEIDCTDYLNKAFGEYAYFIHQGGSDSTAPDILVKTNKGTSFYIEAKHCPAQCGQFVLLPDVKSSTFIYSRLKTILFCLLKDLVNILMLVLNIELNEADLAM